MSQASDNPKNNGENGGGADEDDDDTIIGANDLSEDSDSAASGGIVGRFVGEGGETITVVERDPAWMAELRKARPIMQRFNMNPDSPQALKLREWNCSYLELALSMNK